MNDCRFEEEFGLIGVSICWSQSVVACKVVAHLYTPNQPPGKAGSLPHQCTPASGKVAIVAAAALLCEGPIKQTHL